MQQKTSVASKELEAVFKDELTSLKSGINTLNETLNKLLTPPAVTPTPAAPIVEPPKLSAFQRFDKKITELFEG